MTHAVLDVICVSQSFLIDMRSTTHSNVVLGPKIAYTDILWFPP